MRLPIRVAIIVMITVFLSLSFLILQEKIKLAAFPETESVVQVDRLAPKEAKWADRKSDSLEVQFTTPSGEIEDVLVPQILVVFNKPMVALTDLDNRVGPIPVKISPPVPGKFHWLGTQVLSFQPDGPLRFSTRYFAVVSKSMKSVEGHMLKKDYRWTFETPRVDVLYTRPGQNDRDAEWLKPLDSIAIHFSQPIDVKALKNHLKLVVKDGREYPVGISRPGKAESKRLWPKPNWVAIVQPMKKLPKGTDFQVRIDDKFHGSEGALPMKRSGTLRFSTYGNLRVTSDNSKRDCERTPYIEFSNPILYKNFIKNISITPHVGFGEDVDQWMKHYSAAFYYPATLPPGRNFKVKINGSLKDRFGQTLGKDHVFIFKSADEDPDFDFKAFIGVVESKGPHVYPMKVESLGSARLRMMRITKDKIVVVARGDHHRSHTEDFSEDSATYTFDKEISFDLNKNERRLYPVDLDATLKKKSGLLYLYATKDIYPETNCDRDPYTLTSSALVQVTDIGLIAKRSANKTLIWASSLSSGMPLPNAKIEIRNHFNKVVWSGKTDENGLAVAFGGESFPEENPADEYHGSEIYIIAEKGDDTAFLSSKWTDEVSFGNFGDSEKRQYTGTIFTERDIYRPGEKVYFKGILRNDNNGRYTTPDGDTIWVTIADPEDKYVLDQGVKLNRFGTFSIDFTLPKDAKVGYYSISTLGAKAQFRVEEYRAPEFEVKIDTDKNEYVFGDTIRAKISGRYLFGAPMRREKVEWVVRQSSSWFEPPGHEGFSFQDYVWAPDRDDSENTSDAVLVKKSSALDDGGSFNAGVPARPGTKIQSKNYILEATVIDVNRQAVSESKAVLVHQGEFYIGLKPSDWFVTPGKPVRVEVIAAKPRGDLDAGRSITLKLYRRDWHTVMKEELRGDWIYESKPVDTEKGSCSVTTALKPSACTFKLPKSGYYFVRARATDRRGNTVVSSFDIYVCGGEYVSWQRDESNRIDLIPDKKLYRPGEVAKILVKSPYPRAKALITIEREKLYSWRVMELVGTATTVEVPVDKDFSTNFLVSVVLIQGRTSEMLNKKGKDTGKPSYRIGYANIHIDTSMHRLRVAVKPDKTDYRPGGTVRLKVFTKSSAGIRTPAEVAVMVVDEGVLNLTGYRIPDLMPAFYFERGLEVSNATTYIHVIERENYARKGRNPGGSGKGGGYNIVARSFFATAAYWNPSVVTDKNGEAIVTFKLPDNLTKYRIMAVANTDGNDFGGAENSLRVNKPLMIRPALPRFALAGDVFTAGAALHNYGSTPRAVTVTVDAKNIRLLEPANKTVMLSPKKAQEVRFKFKADKIGDAKFKFTAIMGSETDAVVTSIPVKLPVPIESVAAYGVTMDEARQKIVSPKKVHPDFGGLSVSVSSTALSGLEQGVTQLVDYPYGCLEQTVSRALPLVLLRDIVVTYKIPSLDSAGIEEITKKTIEKLSSFQRSDGGMSFWERSVSSDPYLSAYTLLFLNEAERAKYRVDDEVKDSIIKYMDGLIRENCQTNRLCIDKETEAFMLYVLADANHPMANFYNPLFEARDVDDRRGLLGLRGRAFLSMAMGRAKTFDNPISKMMRELGNHAVMSGAHAHFIETDRGYDLDIGMISDNAMTAAVLMSMVEDDPDNPLIPKVVGWLLRSRKNGKWKTTHEAAFVLMALSKYYKRFESETPDFAANVKIGGRSVLKAEFRDRDTRVEKADLSMRELLAAGNDYLDITKNGRGMMFYSVLMSYSPLKPVLPPVDEGFIVITDYVPYGGKKRTTSFKAGDVAKVSITIFTPIARNYVVVDDPIPAGFEVVNQTFKTSASYDVSEGGEYDYDCDDCDGGYEEERPRKQDPDMWNWWVFNNVDIRDDRVVLYADSMDAGMYRYTYIVRATTAGTFFDPPTKAEEMYNPDVFGRNGSRIIVIK